MKSTYSGMPEQHEKPISRKTALSLAGMYPLPRMGYEIVVAFKPHPIYGRTFPDRLMLGNFSGRFVLFSSTTTRDQWAEVFRVRG